MRIVLASTNPGKLAEFRQGLAGTKINMVPQSIFQVTEIEETASTFVENALLKARHAATQTGLPALADDSGLVVPALGGQPGIHSARFAGTPQNSTRNIEKLLSMLNAIQPATGPSRDHVPAWFHCSLVFLRSPTDPAPLICEGKWQGFILSSPAGENGFGYDPIFLDPASGKTAASLSPEAKQQASHRGQAVAALIRALTDPAYRN